MKHRLLGAALLLPLGCATTQFVPGRLYRGEAYLAMDGGVQVMAHGKEIAKEPGFAGLPELVGCSYEASDQARRARRRGRAAQGLGWTAIVLGLSSVMALGGVAALRQDRKLGVGLIAGGLSAGGLGLAFGLGSRRERSQAVGLAVDAVNFYNDAVDDGRCRRRGKPRRPRRRRPPP